MTNRPITEQDEFLLNRLIDGDLPPGEADALRARMEREPALGEACRRLERLDALLAARRADQPALDWARFHRRVMSRVENEARPAQPVVYKLSKYLRVVLPLAAAAAIALVVWTYSRPAPDQPNHVAGLPNDNHRPDVPGPLIVADSAIVVRYHRVPVAAAEEGIPVAYVRSDELQKEYQEMDNRNRGQQASGALVAVHEWSRPAVSRSVLAAAIASQF